MQEHDIAIDQATTFYADYRWLEDGVPQDTAGMSAVMSISRKYGRDPIITVTSNDDEITLNADNIKVAIPDTKTAKLTRDGVYDLVVVDDRTSPRRVVRVARGKVTVSRAVTQVGA